MEKINRDLTIRPAIENDIPEIMNLLGQVNDVHADGRPDLFIHGCTKYTPDELAKIINNPDTPIFVGIDSTGKMAGYCFCIVENHESSNNLQPNKTLYIDDLCVDESERGKHVGQTIYKYVVSYARETGFYNLTLNVWSCNPGAIRFYESLGMRPYKIGMETIL